MHDPLFICLSSFGGGLLGSIVPVISAEALLLALTLTAPAFLAPSIVLLATAGQMVGKSVFYLAGRGALRLPKGKAMARVRRVTTRLEGRKRVTALVLFVSALIGLPPFYVTTVACGMLGMRFPVFLLVGAGGLLLRFGAIVFLPHVLQGALP